MEMVVKKSLLKNKKHFLVFAVIFMILFFLRITLPYLLKFAINHALSQNFKNYTGSISDFDFELISGQYQIEGLKIYKKSGSADEPFIFIKNSKIQLDWNSLLQGQIVARVYIKDAQMIFIDSKGDQEDQHGADEKSEHWKSALDSIIPLTIKNLYADNVNFIFQNVNIEGFKKHTLFVKNLKAENIISFDEKDSLIEVAAILNQQADVQLKGRANIGSENPRFDLDLKIDRFDLTSANKLLKHYVPIDITKGTLTIFSEFKGDIENGQAYFRVFFNDLDIYELAQELVSIKHGVYEFLGGFVNWVLNEVSDGDLAAEIPLQWEDSKLKVQTGKAFWSPIKNTYDTLKKDFKDL